MFEADIASPLIDGGRAVTPIDPIGRGILRCREEDVGAVSGRLGVDLPREACRSAKGTELSTLWLGPDEWLIVGHTPSDRWGPDLASRLGDVPGAFVDVSHRQVGLSVYGPLAEAILASGCALDLSIGAFPTGMCTRTMFAKAEIVLWRTGKEVFHLEVWRSFAGYVRALLREAADELDWAAF
jgi:sarcosine oxidase subunit gamma